MLAVLMVGSFAVPLDRLEVDSKGDTHDAGQMAWNLWHVAESSLRLENPFFTDRLYHPVGAPLGKHTLVSGYLPLTLLVRFAMGADPSYPIVAFNLAVLVSFTLLCWLSYLLLRRIGASILASAALSVSFAFCDFFFLHYLHLNHVSAFFFPLCAYLLVGLWRRPSLSGTLVFSFAMGSAPYFTEFALSLWLCFGLVMVVAFSLPTVRCETMEWLRALGLKTVIASIALFVFTALPMALAYLTAEAGAPRERDFYNLSANLAGFVIPSPQTTPLYGGLFADLSARVNKGLGGKEVFLGFSVVALAILGLWRLHRPIAIWALATAAVFLTLSLGPSLKIFETDTEIWMPYRALMQVPPFDQNRCPVRFALVGLFALIILASQGLSIIEEKFRRHIHPMAAWIFSAGVLIFNVAECWNTQKINRVPFTPHADVLAQLPSKPVAVVPLKPKPCNQVLMQTVHGRPISNGCLARHSPESLRHLRTLSHAYERNIPGFVQQLEEMGYGSILVTEPIPPKKLEKLRQLSLPVFVIESS